MKAQARPSERGASQGASPRRIRAKAAGDLRVWAGIGALTLMTLVIRGEPTVPAGGDQTNSTVEQLKAFLASPPVIEELVFKTKRPDGFATNYYELGISRMTNYQFGVLSWQQDAFFARFVPKCADIFSNDLTGNIATLCGHEYWVIDIKGREGTYSYISTALSSLTNRALRLVDFHRRQIGEILNLGVFHMYPGTIRWRGNEFIAEKDVPGTHVHIHGWLDISNGNVNGMHVQYRIPTTVANYLIRYQYSSDQALPLYLPRTVTAYWLRNSREIPLAETSILSLRIGAHPLPSEHFDLRPYMIAHRFSTLVITNDMIYTRTASGELRRLRTGQPLSTGKGEETSQKSQYFYFVAVAATAVFFTLIVRAKSRNNLKPSQIVERTIP